MDLKIKTITNTKTQILFWTIFWNDCFCNKKCIMEGSLAFFHNVFANSQQFTTKENQQEQQKLNIGCQRAATCKGNQTRADPKLASMINRYNQRVSKMPERMEGDKKIVKMHVFHEPQKTSFCFLPPFWATTLPI